MFRQSAFVPAYIYPGFAGSDWDKLILAGGKQSAAIMNPASGPGTSSNSDYVNVINRAQPAGVPVFGYVDTNYGARSAADVEADIDKYRNWYKVYNIFFDRAASDLGHISYYQTLYNYVRSFSPNAKVVLNPGTVATTDNGYFTVADYLCVFEGDYAAYQATVFPTWLLAKPASQIVHLVYSVPDVPSMQIAIALAAQRNCANPYITDQALPNPWGKLPAYWADMLVYPGGH